MYLLEPTQKKKITFKTIRKLPWKHHKELKVNLARLQHCSNNIKGSTKRSRLPLIGGIIATEYSIACNPDIFKITGLANTILHLQAYLAWKETAVVTETGRRRPINDSVLAFHRNLSGERVGAKFSSESLPSKSRTIENRPNNSQMQQESQRKYLEIVEISQLEADKNQQWRWRHRMQLKMTSSFVSAARTLYMAQIARRHLSIDNCSNEYHDNNCDDNTSDWNNYISIFVPGKQYFC